MKKITLLLTGILFSVSLFAQETSYFPKSPHKSYFSPYAGFSTSETTSYGVELGEWGITSPFSYAVSLSKSTEQSEDGKKNSYWASIKLYYTAKNGKHIQYLLYIQESAQLADNGGLSTELGINPYLKIMDNIMLGVAFGANIANSHWTENNTVSLILLF